MRKAIGIEVRYLSTMIAKEVEQSQLFKENPDLTNVKGWTMGFIYRRCQKGFDVYQKDIEQEFNISRSTATELLQNLEQNGYITREVSENDGRLKKIVLLEKGIELQKAVIKTLNSVENKVLAGFTLEERELLFVYLERVKKNLERKD